MLENGFISLHRKILNWEWYSSIKTTRLFIHCLLKANFVDGKFEGQVIPRGSFVTSIGNLAKETGLSIQSTREALKHLKTTNEITSKTTNKYTIINVVNYNAYQCMELTKQQAKQQAEQQTNNKQTTNKQQQYNNNNKYNKEINNIIEKNDMTSEIFSEAIQFFNQNVGGSITPYVADRLTDDIDEFGEPLFIEACKQAIKYKAKSLAYIEKVLMQWKDDGITRVDQLDKPKVKTHEEKVEELKAAWAKIDEEERLIREKYKEAGDVNGN